MAWTNPRTWNIGETVTAAMFNTHIRDNLLYLFGIINTGDLKLATYDVAGGGTLHNNRWLLCDGSAVSRTTYSNLNAVAAAAGYASPWGPGNGSTTFNIPDLRDRTVFGTGTQVGLGDNDGAAVGDRGPAHTHNITNHQHGITNHGGHAHNINSTNHTGVGTAQITDTGGNKNRVQTINGVNDGSHAHGGGTQTGGDHDHGGDTISTENVDTGSGVGTANPMGYMGIHYLVHI